METSSQGEQYPKRGCETSARYQTRQARGKSSGLWGCWCKAELSRSGAPDTDEDDIYSAKRCWLLLLFQGAGEHRGGELSIGSIKHRDRLLDLAD